MVGSVVGKSLKLRNPSNARKSPLILAAKSSPTVVLEEKDPMASHFVKAIQLRSDEAPSGDPERQKRIMNDVEAYRVKTVENCQARGVTQSPENNTVVTNVPPEVLETIRAIELRAKEHTSSS